MQVTHTCATALALALVACGAESTKPVEPSAPAPSAAASASVSVAPSTAPSASAAPPVASSSADAGTDAAVATAADTSADAGPPHPAVAISGKCVDPEKDAKVRGHYPKDLPLSIEPIKTDLDGDGVDDWIITTGADAFDYSGEVYITRNDCAIWVLRWVGGAPTPIETSTRGMPDLVSSKPCKVSCCGGPETIFKWNGRVYAKTGTRTAPPCDQSIMHGGHP